MKFNFLKSGLLALALSTTLIGCTDNDPDMLFDKNPDSRLEEKRAELQETLLDSEYGWKVVYFTDNSLLGGFTHLIKFEEGFKVSMASDFNNDTSVYNSEYALELGSTMSLVFNTYNRVHLLSDNSNFPIPQLRGKGYLGDFQWLYYGKSNDGIDFQSNRQHVPIRFEKANEEDWGSLAGNFVTISRFGRMKKLSLQESGNVKSYNVTYGTRTRFAGILSADKTESVNENLGVGVGFNHSSIVISPSIELDGMEYTVFNYMSDSDSFASEDGKVIFSK
ncbi:DUF4302 domain-containing protein [Flavobacterium sp. HSC-61S13]|uniref:DUF4302 domain-containing protein n=1 Tax=Flavobacterium sp. HSC-61S13 TaxID=2910963 RepID=UPI0020A0E9A0|nr:DUF4302 domain-containing protein [Flavobacterium sp. HSC-61S13]MCP1995018.1 hypothetical protein [Flavobacterium sp. HSC-61S13]